MTFNDEKRTKYEDYEYDLHLEVLEHGNLTLPVSFLLDFSISTFTPLYTTMRKMNPSEQHVQHLNECVCGC